MDTWTTLRDRPLAFSAKNVAHNNNLQQQPAAIASRKFPDILQGSAATCMRCNADFIPIFLVENLRKSVSFYRSGTGIGDRPMNRLSDSSLIPRRSFRSGPVVHAAINSNVKYV